MGSASTTPAVERSADGKITIRSAGRISIGIGPASSGAATVPTPSFQPSETPDGERYEYAGVQASVGAATTELVFEENGDIRLKTTGKVIVDGDLDVSGSVYVGGTKVH